MAAHISTITQLLFGERLLAFVFIGTVKYEIIVAYTGKLLEELVPDLQTNDASLEGGARRSVEYNARERGVTD